MSCWQHARLATFLFLKSSVCVGIYNKWNNMTTCTHTWCACFYVRIPQVHRCLPIRFNGASTLETIVCQLCGGCDRPDPARHQSEAWRASEHSAKLMLTYAHPHLISRTRARARLEHYALRQAITIARHEFLCAVRARACTFTHLLLLLLLLRRVHHHAAVLRCRTLHPSAVRGVVSCELCEMNARRAVCAQ